MNINNEVRKHLIAFLNKVLDQSYTRNEWENFAVSIYQNDELETIRKEVVKIISKDLEPKGYKMKIVRDETRDTIQTIINELDRISI